MYQINFLPWRYAFFRRKTIKWLCLLIFIIVISIVIYSYYTFYLAQQLRSLSLQQTQLAQQKDILSAQLKRYYQEKQQIQSHHQQYLLHYQNWHRYLDYLYFFKLIETQLPPTGWITQLSVSDNILSFNVILPNQQSLLFIDSLSVHPLLSSLELSHLQQSKTIPTYTELALTGYFSRYLADEKSHEQQKND
ncbi:hypothetical protein [Proteus myxofaciens]|uniref:PilN family type IV pilus biogenesis protein n=1 Tax=Proteus myxofaciens ATCC 19692 TaxID=1354337 RepID=A0A198FXV7_9GAMM|nr:hypothetical protein [Proteus myxofaciens]OAT29902.1 PilN family type IV pilus biogenesis protein [Proteus myxofaciens ATCC 19692]